MSNNDTLLSVRGLRTYFDTLSGTVRAVDGISFDVRKIEVLGVVGESGCGKTVTALSIMQLLPIAKARIVDGSILLYRESGEVIDIAKLKRNSPTMREIRGKEISMIFQEPMTSLNPVHTVGAQITEGIRYREKMSKKDAREFAIEMLRQVGIPAPEQRVDEYPHQMSGGMRQRVMIATALASNPRLLIADEPTTALDVTVEAQILNLLKELQTQYGMSVMFITHNLGIISQMTNRVIVMYTGRIVESLPTKTLFKGAKHPYTIGLLNSIPRIGLKHELTPIDGAVPNLNELPPGCHFVDRCSSALPICSLQEPPVCQLDSNHWVKCWLYDTLQEVV